MTHLSNDNGRTLNIFFVILEVLPNNFFYNLIIIINYLIIIWDVISPITCMNCDSNLEHKCIFFSLKLLNVCVALYYFLVNFSLLNNVST